MHVTVPCTLLLRVLHAPLFCPSVFQRRQGTHQDGKLRGILILLFFTLNSDGLPADAGGLMHGWMVRWIVPTHQWGDGLPSDDILTESLLSVRGLHFAASTLALPVIMCGH